MISPHLSMMTANLSRDDLHLDSKTVKQVKAIEDWLKESSVSKPLNRAERKSHSGYRALFIGPPGSGKKSAALMIGKEFKRPVYRIDLAKAVSKYIGETEKNLELVFANAESKDWILFFDEADALFGKRTGVKDSHDRYANQEVSYLLQRMEDYNGLAILATNMKTNIDAAFTRRFQSIVRFF